MSPLEPPDAAEVDTVLDAPSHLVADVADVAVLTDDIVTAPVAPFTLVTGAVYVTAPVEPLKDVTPVLIVTAPVSSATTPLTDFSGM